MTQRRHATTNASPEGGFALVVVLGLIVLISALAAGHTRNAHAESMIATAFVQRAEARALAEAGVSRAVLDLLAATEERQWPVDGSEHAFDFEGRTITVGIRKATGLIDLNAADPKLLDDLLRASGVEQVDRERIVDALLDWRDEDDLVRLNGAEADDYRRLGIGWTPRNDKLTSIDELRYVLGITPSTFDAIAPYLTVYSGRSGLEIEYAPPQLVMLLTGREIVDGVRPQSSPAGSFHVRVHVPIREQLGFDVEAVVATTSDREQPFRILHWREGARTPINATHGDET